MFLNSVSPNLNGRTYTDLSFGHTFYLSTFTNSFLSENKKTKTKTKKKQTNIRINPSIYSRQCKIFDEYFQFKNKV